MQEDDLNPVGIEIEETELTYDQEELGRLSRAASESYIAMQGREEDGLLGFQERLHLEVQVEQTREVIYLCNIEISDFVVTVSGENVLSEGNKHKEDETEKRESEMVLTNSEKSQPADIGWFQQMLSALQAFKKTLTIRQVQLTMCLFVMQHSRSANFQSLYLKNYGSLAPFIIPPALTHRPINLYLLEDLFHRETEYLHSYLEEVAKLKSFWETNRESVGAGRQALEAVVGRMKVWHSKIKTISEVFPYACVKDSDDLFSFSACHPRWQHLTATDQIRHVALADQQTLALSFAKLKHNLTVVNAAMSVIDRQKMSPEQPLTSKVVQIMETASQVVRMALFKGEAHNEAEIMIAEPEEALAKQIWNLPENKNFKQFINLSLPSISFSELLYLPRVLREYFSLRYWQGLYEELPDMIIEDRSEYGQLLTKNQNYKETIRVRVNAPFKLQRKEDKKKQDEEKGIFGMLTNFFSKQSTIPRKVIFHIHGGGFISMSSFIHQAYTRHWATNLNVPIVSVDYGKAPNHPFPEGLYDCLEAYLWTLLVFKQIYEVYPQKIVIVGDSAGGNLSAALTTLLLQWNLPIPTGLVLVYPALNLNLNDYTPSLLTALNDMILPHTFLKLCRKAYLRDERLQPQADPLISPILTPMEVLAKYPKTQIFVGNKDPFHDDCCRLVERMNIAKKGNAKLTIFQEFPHGFLQFDLRMFPNQYTREATQMVQKALGTLLQV